MKSRKRILSAVLTAGLVISLAGCAENEQNSPESSVTSTEASTPESKTAESTADDTSTTPHPHHHKQY